MAESKPKKSTSSAKAKVFDVAPPSQNVEPATSRPIIVGRSGAIQKDPMVAPVEQPKAEEKSSEDKPALVKPKRELVLQPIDATTSDAEPALEEPDANTEESDEVVVDSSITEDPSPEEATIQEPDDNSEDTSEIDQEPESETESTEVESDISEDSEEASSNPDADSGSGAVEALVAGVNTKKERKDQEEKEAKRQEEIQAMIASKKYNVKTHIPPGKRNIIWLIVLIIIAVLGVAGWYLGVGPGRSIWDKKPAEPATANTSQTAPVQNQSQKTQANNTPTVAKLKNYNDPRYGISFAYPSDWIVSVAKDKEFNTRDIITITSPSETIKTTASDSTQVDSEVFLRTKIIVENTKSATEYASDLVDLASCASEDVIVQSTTLKLLYVDATNNSPSVSKVSVSPSNCVAVGSKFAGNDQIQFPKKSNTYIIYTEYVFSDAYLKKNGTTTADAIALAQGSGVAATKESFKAGKNLVKFQDLVKSLKEL